MELLRSKTSLFVEFTSKSFSDTKIWIDNPANTKKKIFVCIGSVWILTDFVISILQRVTDTEEKNILGPFTYLSVKSLNRNQQRNVNNPINNNNALIFGIPSNLQFSSTKGLAKNMLGGLCIGIGFGISSLSIFNSIIASNKDSLKSVIQSMSPWSLYVFNSCIFYTMEYLWAAIFHPKDVSFSSFMLYNHSNEFHIALCISTMEYWMQYLLFPDMKIILNDKYGKYLKGIHLYGLGLVVFGQIIRTVAQFTAGINFTHQIAYYKKKEHELIQHGIYRYLRHPSYFGFFYWSIGTQLLLANPLSTIVYTGASWYFFADRIPYVYIMYLLFIN